MASHVNQSKDCCFMPTRVTSVHHKTSSCCADALESDAAWCY